MGVGLRHIGGHVKDHEIIGLRTTGTRATSWMLDYANTVAGNDMSILFNRGSTDTDASLTWNETSDQFFLYSDQDPTLATLNANVVASSVTLTGFTNSSVLFIDGGVVAQDNSNFTYNDTTDTLYSKNITGLSLNINSSTTITQTLDEDNMASDSATALATQQSIKAYMDTINTLPRRYALMMCGT